MRFVTPRSLFIWSVARLPSGSPPSLPASRYSTSRRHGPGPGQPADRSVGRPSAQSALSGIGTPVGQTPATHTAAGIYQAIGAPLARKGIQLTPVLSPAALTSEQLAYYDALMLYGNHTAITPDQEKALVEFVEGGKGVVALHSASEMFGGSERYAMLIGAQSQRQGAGSRIHGRDRAAVSSRGPGRAALCHVGRDGRLYQAESDRSNRPDGARRRYRHARPGPGCATQGKGRVFYTAYGHDQRTWNNPGFQTLIERAVVWGVPEPARQAWQQLKMPAVTYVDGIGRAELREPRSRRRSISCRSRWTRR